MTLHLHSCKTHFPAVTIWPPTLLEKFCLILLYVTDDAITKLVKFSQIEGNGRKCRHKELSVIT